MKRIINSTRERILSSAITAMARVNLAAVNYHFGSKEALIEAVYERRLEPLNKARLRNLRTLKKQYGDEKIPIEEVIEAFVMPLVEISDTGDSRQTMNILRLIGRTYSEAAKQFRKLFAESYHSVLEQYQEVLAKSLPKLSSEEINWRLQFTIGAMSHSFVESELLGLLSGEDVTPDLIKQQVKQLMPFIIAGFKSKAPTKTVKKSKARKRKKSSTKK